MPTHNSYFDFLLVSFISFAVNLPLPGIAAGHGEYTLAKIILPGESKKARPLMEPNMKTRSSISEIGFFSK